MVSLHLLTGTPLKSTTVPSHNLLLQYSSFTHRGFYPDTPTRKNQDSLCIKTHIQNNPNLHFFGVFDGHGEFGAECSNFVSARLVDILSGDPKLVEDPEKALVSAILATNSDLHESQIDDRSSGTTAITVLVKGNTLFVANVGDSRAVIGEKIWSLVVADEMSSDHKPWRADEYERLRKCGAIVMSLSRLQRLSMEGEEEEGDHKEEEQQQQEGEGGGDGDGVDDPPRIWVLENGGCGLAFSRSLGDSMAWNSGVIAEPEVRVVKLKPNHQFFVIASDGVFDYLSSQTLVHMVGRHTDPRDACAYIAGESYRRWLASSSRTDDITIITVYIENLPSYTNNQTKINTNGIKF